MGPVDRMFQRASEAWQGPGVRLALPYGRDLDLGPAGDDRAAVMRVQDLRAIRRLLLGGDIGLAEGYVAGEWETPDLARVLTALAANFEALSVLGLGHPLHRAAQAPLKLLRANTPRGARRNIHAHYDLGNDFYGAWLDEGMSYSSALYGFAGETLEAAQTRKYAALAQAIGLRAGQSVLELGCGWGGFAEFAAREAQAKVTAVTISSAQHAYASARVARAGLADRVDVRLCDYRRTEGRFDRVVSIEMFEAVGERFWPTFFQVLQQRLAPDGCAGLQVITMRQDLFAEYRRRVDFIQKYIFPGGMLPSEERLQAGARQAGLHLTAPRRFGADYATTVRDWAARFERAWPLLEGKGFDRRFHRLWRFYLAYCEAGFATGRTDVWQFVLRR